MNDRVPCRVTADLRIKERREEQYVRDEFNEFFEEHVRAVVPYELAKPVQELLLALHQIELANRSFGADKVKCFDSLIQPLKDLRQACADRFRDQ